MTPTQTDGDLAGRGEELLALVRNYATPQQWAAWLRVPLGGAAAEGNASMVNLLVEAGADAGPGQREVRELSERLHHVSYIVSIACLSHHDSFHKLFTWLHSFYIAARAEGNLGAQRTEHGTTAVLAPVEIVGPRSPL